MSVLGPIGQRVHARLLADGPDTADGASMRDRVAGLVRAEAPLLGLVDASGVVDEVLATVIGLGPLEPLLADPDVTDVMVNGPGRVWVERAGVLVRTAVELDTAAVEHLIERVVAPLGLRIDRSSPMVDARLPDGSRVNAVVPPLAIDGPCLTVRRFGARPVALDEFCTGADVAAMLHDAVTSRANIVVSGGTGAGKTTLLNALAARIPPAERVVTVEDAAELRLPGEHVVRLESRPANAEGAGEVRLRALVRNALRMRPDRLIVGEVRGDEALDMLQAMNTGHDGSLSTCHANGPDDALRRIETMVLSGHVALPLAAVREQIASAIDLVVQVARAGGGRRVVREVAEVLPDPAGGLVRTRRLAGADGVGASPRRPPRWAGP
ncbi:MAG: Flp pilus assembly protein ATPase CpaF [Acidimicrobiales bacterium]|nr:Flp pilus assembly protein ATPase CpaF [Acidimicrobiales bacterium]